jgi:hypothetical protein
MGAPAAIASLGGPGRAPGAPTWLTWHNCAIGIRFHVRDTSRRVGSRPRVECGAPTPRAAVQRSGSRPDAKPACGSAAGRAQRGRVGSLHRSLHHSAIGFRHPRDRTTARVRSRCAVERRQRCHTSRVVVGLATDKQRGPFGFSRWGRGKRVRCYITQRSAGNFRKIDVGLIQVPLSGTHPARAQGRMRSSEATLPRDAKRPAGSNGRAVCNDGTEGRAGGEARGGGAQREQTRQRRNPRGNQYP